MIICLIITGFLLPQSAGKAAFKAVSLGAYSYAPYKNKETKAATENTQQAKSKVENVAVKKEKKKSTFSFQTDEDVQSLIDKYKAVAEKDEKDAAISEENLHESGKTESYADVFVKNTNKTPADIKEHLERRAELSVDKSKPAVLIYHTHTTESYQILDRDFYAAGFKSRSNSDKLNMVRVGDAICAALENAGFKVIHDRNIYDAAYSGAYYRSYDAAEKIINENPSVHITLDIHRDAIQYDSGTKVKPTASVNGKKAAQIMIISGCQEKGNGIEDFPDWDKNLTFALHLQQQLEKDYSGLTRPVFFCARDYNMNLTPCSLLIEIGTDGNTLEEAVYSGKLLGASLARLMENYIEEE
ncbi:MAG: stage II sporulation protein P [Clostridia bacterium]|nr:stage II sporulation protein P [Clostridia bacterium]